MVSVQRLAVSLVVMFAGAGLAEELSLRTGVTWYRFQDEDRVVGMSRLDVDAREGGGYHLAMRIACTVGSQSLDRSRALTLDSAGRMTAASYADAITEERAELALEGDHFTGWHEREEGARRSSIQVTRGDTIYSGLVYLLALAMPREAGAELVIEELSAAGGFTNLGRATIRCKGEEVVEGFDGEQPVRAFRYEKTSERGRPLTLWVSAEGEMLRANWGGGLHSIRADSSTEGLYVRSVPAVSEVPGEDEDRLHMAGSFPGWTAAELYRHWIEPRLLRRWWPEEARVEPEAGGAYTLSWPSMGRELQGTIVTIEPPRHLALRWRWDGDEDADVREVDIVFTAVEGGTQVAITQGPYPATPEGKEERRGHVQGWEYFCTKLRDLER